MIKQDCITWEVTNDKDSAEVEARKPETKIRATRINKIFLLSSSLGK
jgi:hypothetical protein